MSHPLRVVAHLGDVVKDLLQGPIDLDAFFDTHGSASCAPNTFSAAMMPPHEALRTASTLYSPNCRQGVFSEAPIHPLGYLCVRTRAKGSFCNRLQNSSIHLATPLNEYFPPHLFAEIITQVYTRQIPFTKNFLYLRTFSQLRGNSSVVKSNLLKRCLTPLFAYIRGLKPVFNCCIISACR